MKKIVITNVLFLFLTLLLTGCNQGPAERKGKEIDKKIESMKDKIENKGPAQKAGEKLDELSEPQ